MWDPGQYLRYADERARPFFDLLSRVQQPIPGTSPTWAVAQET
jgi:trans-aconitate 2-methyltransferase